MGTNQHRNWLLTIAQVNFPFILWGTLIVVILAASMTYFFRPIYWARTTLVLDSDLDQVLKNVDTAYPAMTNSKYIRYEYFATHSLNMMRVPQIAQQVASQWDIRGASGEPLQPESLIEPGMMRLVFGNDGQGIKLQWITDTQQFAIIGYARDPERAVDYSKEYAEAFIEHNSGQLQAVMLPLLERLRKMREDINGDIEDMDREVIQIKLDHHISDPATEHSGLITKIQTIMGSIDQLEMEEKAYKAKIDHLTREDKNFEKLQKVESVISLNPMVTNLRTEIENLTRAMVASSVDFTPEHPDYIAAEKKLKSAKESLKKEAEKAFSQEVSRQSSMHDTVLTQLLTLTLSHIIFEHSLESYKSMLDKYYDRQNEIVMVQSAIDNFVARKQSLVSIMGDVDKSAYTLQSVISGVTPIFRVLSPATTNLRNPAYYKYFPQKKAIVIWSALIAFCVLTFVIVAKELHANVLYNEWQLSSIAGTVSCAEIPQLDVKRGITGSMEQVICCNIHNVCRSAKDSRILRITSWTRSEGKATVARALAWYYQRLGGSVIVIDGDVPCRSLSRAYGLGDHLGLMDYIEGQRAARDEKLAEKIVVCREEQYSPADECGSAAAPAADRKEIDPRASYHRTLPAMPLIPTGNSFSSNGNGYKPAYLTQLFTILAARYERIIFVDSPITEDYLLLADSLPSHDVVMVVESGKHSVYDPEHALEMSRSAADSAALKGIIVNKAPHAINVFTIGGLFQFALHIFSRPLHIIRKALPK
jgi:Mrp family chromosome partitioning ATPase/uncharacterized protein involved in exopolysaccharide biosynthesis